MKFQYLCVFWDFFVQFTHLFNFSSITGPMMDSKSKDEESLNLEQCFHQDATYYTVNYSHERKTEEVPNLSRFLDSYGLHILMKRMCLYLQAVHDKTEDFNKKRQVFVSSVNYIMCLFSDSIISTDVGIFLSIHSCPVVRSGNNTGRAKRVVSCKRKSHHPLARRKQPGKTFTPSNNDGQQEIFASDPLEFPVITNNRRRTGNADVDQDGCSLFNEVRHIISSNYTSPL